MTIHIEALLKRRLGGDIETSNQNCYEYKTRYLVITLDQDDDEELAILRWEKVLDELYHPWELVYTSLIDGISLSAKGDTGQNLTLTVT